jgi:hypothetical protein
MTRVLLFVSVLLALAGCAALADLNELSKDLNAEGYEIANVHHNTTNGHAVLRIDAVRPNEVATADHTAEIAELAWDRFAGDFDELWVTVNADEKLTATHDELTERFGERPAQVRPESESGGSKAVTIIVILAVAVVGTVLLVLHARRGRRPPPPPMAPSTYHYPPTAPGNQS